MQLLQEFIAADLQLLPQQVERIVHRAAEHVAHAEELGLLVVDDAAVGRDADLAVGEGIEGVERLVAADARSEVNKDLHLGGGVVIDLADFDFSLLAGLQYGVYDGAGDLPVRDFAYGQRLVVHLFYFRAHA